MLLMHGFATPAREKFYSLSIVLAGTLFVALAIHEKRKHHLEAAVT